MNKISFDDLKDKVCALTGAGGVIGTSLAKGLSNAGVKLAIIDLDEAAANKTAALISKIYKTKTISVRADVLNKKSLDEAKEVINKKLGRIDLLINGAGGNSPKATTKAEFINRTNLDDLSDTFFALDLDGFREVFDLNFIGTLLPTMVFARDMIETGKGAILNISSMNSFRPLTKIPGYSAAKASINNFTQWLAVHFAKTNIRVNAIAPGFFITNQNKYLLFDERTNELTKRGKKIIDSTPMGKFGEPDDLQGITLFLLSDISRFVTGVVIPIDGGFSAYSGV